MGNDTRNSIFLLKKTPPPKISTRQKRSPSPKTSTRQTRSPSPKTSTCQTRLPSPKTSTRQKRPLPPKTSAQTCLGSSLRRPHTHYYYDNPSVAEEEIQNPYLRLTIPNHSIHPQLSFPTHGVDVRNLRRKLFYSRNHASCHPSIAELCAPSTTSIRPISIANIGS